MQSSFGGSGRARSPIGHWRWPGPIYAPTPSLHIPRGKPHAEAARYVEADSRDLAVTLTYIPIPRPDAPSINRRSGDHEPDRMTGQAAEQRVALLATPSHCDVCRRPIGGGGTGEDYRGDLQARRIPRGVLGVDAGTEQDRNRNDEDPSHTVNLSLLTITPFQVGVNSARI